MVYSVEIMFSWEKVLYYDSKSWFWIYTCSKTVVLYPYILLARTIPCDKTNSLITGSCRIPLLHLCRGVRTLTDDCSGNEKKLFAVESLVQEFLGNVECPFIVLMLRLYVTFTGAWKYETLTTLRFSGTKRLLTSWLWFFDTKRETQFLLSWLYYLNQQTRGASRIPQLDFFQNHQILSPSLTGRTSFNPQSHFLSGVFIMTFVIVISSAHEHEVK